MNSNFFIQFAQRIAASSPKFFVIIRWFTGVVGLVCVCVTFLITHKIWNPSFAASVNSITSAAWPVITGIFGMSWLPVSDTTTSTTPKS